MFVNSNVSVFFSNRNSRSNNRFYIGEMWVVSCSCYFLIFTALKCPHSVMEPCLCFMVGSICGICSLPNRLFWPKKPPPVKLGRLIPYIRDRHWPPTNKAVIGEELGQLLFLGSLPLLHIYSLSDQSLGAPRPHSHAQLTTYAQLPDVQIHR